jgi:hypothetical protein
MSDALDLAIADVPDHWTVLLPSRAYLLSVRDQTLPSRRFALEDAAQHYALAAADSDLGVRDMALLGIIGEALQVIEDIAYFATAFSAPIPGLAHYVSATIYNAEQLLLLHEEAFRGGAKGDCWPLGLRPVEQ